MRYFLLFLTIYAICTNSYAKTVKVAVIDTGISSLAEKSLKVCEKHDFSNTGPEDHHGHGTNVAGLIGLENKDIDYCLIILKYMDRPGLNTESYLKALKKAVELKPDVLNLSLGGFSFLKEEAVYIKQLLDNGTEIVVSAGNENMNLNLGCNYYPACLDKRLHVIGNISQSNYGRIVDVVIDGQNKQAFNIVLSGSSQSAALYTKYLIRNLYERQKSKN